MANSVRKLLLPVWLMLATWAPPVSVSAEPGALIGRVVRVQDGDSLILSIGHEQAVRLAGIDAPELDQAHGREAQARLRACAAGRMAVFVVRDTDRHRRPVGTLEMRGGEDCALSLLRAGLAWYYRAYEHSLPTAQRHSYAQAERQAKQARRGLWADESPQAPWDWRRAQTGDEAR